MHLLASGAGLAAPSCSNETPVWQARGCFPLWARVSLPLGTHAHLDTKKAVGLHHEADSIPSSPAPALAAKHQQQRIRAFETLLWLDVPTLPIDWTMWLHYSCPGRTPQNRRRQIPTRRPQVHYGCTGCHTHSTMHARTRSLAVEAYCQTVRTHLLVYMYCIVRSRPSGAVQSRARSGSLSLGSREFARQFPGCCIAP